MEQKLSIPLLRFMYLISRKRKKRNNICVLRGGKMSDEQWEKAMDEVKLLTDKK